MVCIQWVTLLTKDGKLSVCMVFPTHPAMQVVVLILKSSRNLHRGCSAYVYHLDCYSLEVISTEDINVAMSERSVQSSSKRAYEEEMQARGTNVPDKRQSHQRNDKDKQISQLLSRSLAIYLSRVQRECGSETAQRILEVLTDECFDLPSFKKEVSTIEKCNDITEVLMNASGK